MNDKNKISRKEKSILENSPKDNVNINSDLYPTNENIYEKNAESSYYTPNGD